MIGTSEIEAAKEYAISRTLPRFEDDRLANFVLREIEGAYEQGAQLYKSQVVELLEQNRKLRRCGNCGHFCGKSYRNEYHTECDLDHNDVNGEEEACEKWNMLED